MIPKVSTKVVWPKTRDITISYCRILLKKSDAYRTGISTSSARECGYTAVKLLNILSYIVLIITVKECS